MNFLHRTTNIALNNVLGHKNLWDEVSKVKMKYLKERMVYPLNCVRHDTHLITYFWQGLIENLETVMNLTKDETLHENVKDEDLKEGFRVHLYLAMCHKRVIESPFFKFYNNLFRTSSAKNILLSLNRLIKVSENLKDKVIEDISRKLLNRLENKVKVYYRDIEDLKTKGKVTNIQITVL